MCPEGSSLVDILFVLRDLPPLLMSVFQASFFPSLTCVCVCVQERNAGDANRYNEIVRHETLRVAVCDMLEKKCQCPDTLQ